MEYCAAGTRVGDGNSAATTRRDREFQEQDVSEGLYNGERLRPVGCKAFFC